MNHAELKLVMIDWQKLKEALVTDLGESILEKVTDENIQQYAKALDIAVEVAYLMKQRALFFPDK